jgi:Tfp pilus assembly protein PilX
VQLKTRFWVRGRFVVRGFQGEKMSKGIRDSRGFTLIAALLLTLLLSALAVGLIYTVSSEQRMGGNDLEGNIAYYQAESGIENLTANLSQLYQSSQSPDAASILALESPSLAPNMISGSNITNTTYNQNISWPSTQSNGTPCPNAPNPCGAWDIVGSGQDQGMVASLIQFNLSISASRASTAGEATTNNGITPNGASMYLSRTVEVALLPAFEFGVFCNTDCDYFAGPNFNFGGRVHSNGNLFLASGAALTFTDKVAAVGQVIVDQLENGWPTSNGYGGRVYIPTAAGACPGAPGSGPAANCDALTSGSWSGGFYPYAGAAVSGWPTASGPWNGFVLSGSTGATTLNLPFVQSSNVGPIEIIRRPAPTDSTLLTNSRMYNKAEIRILLADTQGDLHPGRVVSDPAQDVQLTGSFATTAGQMYYGMASTAQNANWVTPTGCTAGNPWPLLGEVTATPCQSVWLRVEYINNAGAWVGVTQQWLGYGFGRPYDMPPTHPYNATNSAASASPLCPANGTFPNWPLKTANNSQAQCQNPISPAILILQQLQSNQPASGATGAATTAYNWLPLNFYDAREGEPRDARPSGDPMTACSPVGVMNAVELDMGNLWLWLQGSGPYSGGSGTSVSITDQNGNTENGYIIYFSDHRGMLRDTNPLNVFYNGLSGMSGLNDVVNSASSTGVPDNALEPITYYATATPPYSPEDPGEKSDGILDKWGEANLGSGFGLTGANQSAPYYISGSYPGVTCYPKAEWNMVSGARHVLRLVDSGMDNAGNSYLPPTNGNSAVNGVGVTITSEEPVYIYGDYNTGIDDPYWPSANNTATPHSAAAIIADSVTLLSNPPSGATLPTVNTGWYDHESFLNPALSGNRPANNSYYRLAIAAGKSVPFPEPGWATALGWKDFGTDGGMHNFLRYLEDRGANGGVVNYSGSLISMYYSQYDTGIFKCCTAVYGAPTRNYFFDTQFLNPNNLPPGTPMFQDVVSLSYHQNFNPNPNN